jgi:hypothetical protein
VDKKPAHEPTHAVQRGGLYDLCEDRSLVSGLSAEQSLFKLSALDPATKRPDQLSPVGHQSLTRS